MAKKIIQELSQRRYFPVFRDYMPTALPGLDQCTQSSYIKDPAFVYLFLKNRHDLDDWNKKEVPINFIWTTMIKYALPVYSEYVETNDAPAFLEIAEIFFKNLFWAQKIYIGCDYFKEGKKPEDFDFFSVWLKICPEWFDRPGSEPLEPDDFKNRFLNLQDGEEYDLGDDWDTELIAVNWPLLNNFPEWFNFSYGVIIFDKLLQNTAQVAGKVVNIEYEGPALMEGLDDSIIKENLNALYNSNAVIFTDRNKTGGESTPISFMTPDQLKAFVLSIYHVRDRQLAELGRVANLNPKGDRLSTGENYKDLIGVANRQRAILNMLKLFALKVKEKGGPDLSFAMNGIPERSPAPTDSETAPLPVSDHADR